MVAITQPARPDRDPFGQTPQDLGRWRRIWDRAAVWAAIVPVVLAMIQFVPWDSVHLPTKWYDSDLRNVDTMRPDRSFIIAQVEVFRRQLQFGPEITWTYGPLGFLLFDSTWVPPHYLPLFFAARASLAALFGLLCWGLVRSSAMSSSQRVVWWAVMLLLWAVCINGRHSAFWMSFPLAAALLHGRRANGKGSVDGLLLTLAVACGIVSLLKFTFLLYAAFQYVVLGLWDIRERRRPIYSCAFALAFLGSWSLAGQSPLNIPTYFAASLDLSGGYSAAMAKGFIAPFRRTDIVMFGIASVTPFAVFFMACWRANRRNAIFQVIGPAALLFIANKHAWGGNHLGNATSTAVLLTLFYLTALPRREGRAGIAWPRMSIAGMAVLAGLLLWHRHDNFFQLVYQSPKAIGLSIVASKAKAFGRLPVEAHRETYAAWNSRVWQLASLPPGMSGTADFLGDNGGLIVPHRDLVYHPRPMYLSLNAHTEQLAVRNRRHFSGDDAPQWLLTEIVDLRTPPYDRYPTLSDGPAYLELLSRYRFHVQTPTLLVFKHRPNPLPYRLEPLVDREVAWGKECDVCVSGSDLIWAQVDARYSAAGRLCNFVYKPPRIDMTVESDQERTAYKLVPEMGRAGFLLSPRLHSNEDLLFLSGAVRTGGRVESLDTVRTVRFDLNGSPDELVEPTVRLRLFKLVFPTSDTTGDTADGQQTPEISRIERLLQLRLGCEAGKIPPSWHWLPIRGESVLQLHAPSRARAPVPAGARQLHIVFGLRDTAYTAEEAQSDGATFRVSSIAGSGEPKDLLKDQPKVLPKVLWERSLDPTRNVAERQTFEVIIPLPEDPPEAVLFETLPGPKGDIIYDHTYWADVRFE